MKLKHSIGQLALVILFFGVSFKALVTPSPLWASTIFGLALALFTLALVGTIFGHSARRASFGGAAICGWIYMIATYGPWTAEAVGIHLPTSAWIDILYPAISPRPHAKEDFQEFRTNYEQLSAMLEQARLNNAIAGIDNENDPTFQSIARRLTEATRKYQAASEVGATLMDAGKWSRWSPWTKPDLHAKGTIVVAPESFQRIGHSLCAIAFATAGGAFARLAAGGDPRANPSSLRES